MTGPLFFLSYEPWEAAQAQLDHEWSKWPANARPLLPPNASDLQSVPGPDHARHPSALALALAAAESVPLSSSTSRRRPYFHPGD